MTHYRTGDSSEIKLNADGCLYKIVPNLCSIDKDEYNNLLMIEQLYININQSRENFLVVKGLFNSQFEKLNYSIIIMSFIISVVNLVLVSLGDRVHADTNIAFQIFIGILGLLIAITTKSRDQKVDLVHNMLSTVEKCDIFLQKCQYDMSNLIMKYDNNYFQEILTSLLEEYDKTLPECNKIFSNFNTLEAHAIVNGPIPYIDIRNLCSLFNGKWIKQLYNDDKNKHIIIGNENKEEIELVIQDNENIELGITNKID